MSNINLTKTFVMVFMDSPHNECCLFNCGLWPLGSHWPHKLTNLSGQCPLSLPHKVCVSSCCQSLPCAVWLDQTWVFFSPPCVTCAMLCWCASTQSGLCVHSSLGYRDGLQLSLSLLYSHSCCEMYQAFSWREVWWRNHWVPVAEQSSSGATVSVVMVIHPGRSLQLGLPWDQHLHMLHLWLSVPP